MPKTKINAAMTGVFLFMAPVVTVSCVAMAEMSPRTSSKILYGVSAALLAWFWRAVLKANTLRAKSEGRIEQADKDIAMLNRRPVFRGDGDAKTRS